jgi:hypothetical protein
MIRGRAPRFFAVLRKDAMSEWECRPGEALAGIGKFLRSNAALLLAWNLPLLLALWEYQLGSGNLLLMQHTGLRIAIWDDETASAIRLIYRTYHNAWLFQAAALFTNAVFILTRSGGWLRYLRWSTFAVLVALSLCYASLAEHLGNKALGVP